MFGLGSSSQLGIGISIELEDKFSGRADKVAQRLKTLKDNAHSAVTSAIQDYRNQSLAVAAAAGAASIAMFSVAKAGAEFQHSVNQTYIVGGKELGKTREQLAGFAKDLSKTFTRDPLEISRAMFENVKQGVTQGLEEMTKYQVAVAAATDEQLEGTGGVANTLLSIMHTMDLPISKFKDLSNIVTSVANATQASVYSIGEAMQYGAFTAHQFNLPLVTTAALFGKIANSGIPGSRVGTSVNNMLTRLAKSLGPLRTKRQVEAWKGLGLDPDQMSSMINSGNIIGVVDAFGKASQTLSPVNKGSILPTLLGMRGTVGMEALFNSKNGNTSVGDIIKQATAAQKQDLVMQQSKAMMNDLHSDFIFIANAFHRFRIAFAKAAEPTLRKMFQVGMKVMDFISNIVDSPIGKIFAGIATVVAPVIAIMFAFRAALFTATIALRGFNARQFTGGGGLSGLLGAGLNMAGSSRFGNGAVARNSMGRFYVPKGNPGGLMNEAGVLKRGGSLLSKVELAGMGLGVASSSGFMSGGIGILGTIASGIFRLIPIIGGIFMGVEILKSLGVLSSQREKRTQQSEGISQYYRSLDEQYWGIAGTNRHYLNGGKNVDPNAAKSAFNQSLVINIDGRQATDNNISKSLSDNLNATLNIIQKH